MRRLLVLAVLPFLMGSASPPTGTISLDQPTPHYGDTVTFTTTTDVPHKGFTYTNVVCSQGTTVVFQSSVAPFTLTDQAGQGLEWDGQAAECIGSLVYRVDKGPNTTITYLDQMSFHVDA